MIMCSYVLVVHLSALTSLVLTIFSTFSSTSLKGHRDLTLNNVKLHLFGITSMQVILLSSSIFEIFQSCISCLQLFKVQSCLQFSFSFFPFSLNISSFWWGFFHVLDVEFGRLQARDMLQHLWTGPISNASVDVVQGLRSVEVRAVGVTKVTTLFLM